MTLDPIVIYALVAAAVFLLGFALRWDDLEIGEKIYAIAVALVIAGSILFMPFYIPATGRVVFAPAWDPPRYDVVDPIGSRIFTPEAVEQTRKELPITLSDDFFNNSTKIRLTARPWHQGLWWGLIDLACFGGWFFVPQWLEGVVNPPRRRKSDKSPSATIPYDR